jgi:hypothetical protein
VKIKSQSIAIFSRHFNQVAKIIPLHSLIKKLVSKVSERMSFFDITVDNVSRLHDLSFVDGDLERHSLCWNP